MSRWLCALLCGALVVPAARAQQSEDMNNDTAMVDLGVTIEVLSRKVTPGRTPFPFEKDRFNQVLTQHGFGLITKGVFLAQDIQADGFKRDDIAIVVDGERYHSACPNRMDSPLARSNSLEMDAIELNKTSASCCSGIGGSVAYHRRPVSDRGHVRSGITHSAGASESSDIGFSATSLRHRLAGRYAFGSGYTDGDGRTFVDRYGYRADVDYQLAEMSMTGERHGLQYRGDFTYTEDVMFPYLQMDERLNRVFSGSVSYRGHKLYTNYTEHRMDNGLRTNAMRMATDARNTTFGLTGPVYEAFYRHWRADNEIVTPMGSIQNRLMPGVNQFSVSGFHRGTDRSLLLWVRAGLSRFTIADNDRASFYTPLYGSESSSRTFVTGAAGAALRRTVLSDLTGLLSWDVVSEPPSAQSLYIAVQRPMGKPSWSGNPGLRSPIRTALRGTLESRGLALETSVSYVWDYVDLTRAQAQDRDWLTYDNFNAVLVAANLRGSWRHLEFSAGYTWAERDDDGTPIAEIPPFRLTYTLTSPEIGRGNLYWRHTYNDAQMRVDRRLQESASGSWQRFDAGLHYTIASFRLNAEVENIFDELYTQHLSYLRDPFAAGVRVYEPGRSVRISLVFDGVS